MSHRLRTLRGSSSLVADRVAMVTPWPLLALLREDPVEQHTCFAYRRRLPTAPSLAGGRGLLSGVDPFTKLRWVASACAVIGGGFYVVSLPSLLADLAKIAREGNSRVPC